MTAYDIETVFIAIGMITTGCLIGALIGEVIGRTINGVSRLIRKAGRWNR
jgi:hypothetical protein